MCSTGRARSCPVAPSVRPMTDSRSGPFADVFRAAGRGWPTSVGLDVLGDMSAALTARYGVGLDRITCNLYRDGRDSVAWHGDRIARDLPQATVAVVALGEPRPFRLRPRDGGSSMS